MIAIFWLMAILTLAVFASMAVVRIQANVVTAESHSKRARELAEKGVALAVHPGLRRSDPLLVSEGDSEGYRATYQSMATNFGLNALIAEMIQETNGDESVLLTNTFLGNLFTIEWGMDESDADFFLSNIIEWVDGDDVVNTLNGWESQNYEQEGITGRPFNRYFKTLEELSLVQGYAFLEAVRPDWRDFFNVWTRSTVDLSSAQPEIISLASVTQTGRLISLEEAELIYDQVIGQDGLRDTEDDLMNGNVQQILSENSVGDPSAILSRFTYEGETPEFFQVVSEGWSGDVRITVTIALQGRGNSPQLLERKEVIDYSP